MRFNCKPILKVLSIFVLSASAHCMTWEETDGEYFAIGDLAAVKRILSKEEYSGELLIDAFNRAAMSGNIELVRYLEQLGWGKICLNSKTCNPVNFAVLSSKRPKMVAYLLSRGFPPTRFALFSAAAQVVPDHEQLAGGLESVKLLCEHGGNPEETQQIAEGRDNKVGPTVREELENRINGQYMDLGEPLRSARGKAAEAQVAAFFKKGSCKKGADTSTDLDDFLAIAQAIKRGAVNEKFQTVLNAADFSPQVETYLLYEAIASGNLELIGYFKSSDWFKRCRANFLCRPLDVAAEVGADLKIFQFLASEGFEIDSLNPSGGTPLMYATLNARVDAVKFLCEHGADYRKRVRLEIYDRSIVSILRRSYSSAWDNANAEGLGLVAGDDVPPQSSVSRPECMPGGQCMSVLFPPKGSEMVVRELKSLAEIFQYFMDGHCQPNACTSQITSKAALIGSNVYLHANPSINSNKIDALPFGTVLNVLDSSRTCESLSSRKGRWIRVQVQVPAYPHTVQSKPKAEGWVFDAYVDYFPGFEP